MKKALITGITGQDGSYLTELLLEKGYEVHGIKRRSSSFNTSRIDHLYQDPHDQDPRLILHYGDLTDSTNLIRIIQQVQPDEIYNLGGADRCRGGLQRRPAVGHEQARWNTEKAAGCQPSAGHGLVGIDFPGRWPAACLRGFPGSSGDGTIEGLSCHPVPLNALLL